jgi:hypothetical protein
MDGVRKVMRHSHRCRCGGQRSRVFLFVAVGLVFLAGAAGCTRRFFRTRADLQVDSLMGEKDKYPFWKIDQYHVYPDPRARFADWTNPDRPPVPPDDPAAYDLSPRPQKTPKAGVAYIEGTGYLDLLRKWDKENRARQEKDLEAARERRRARGTARATPEELTLEERDRQIEEQIERELARPVGRDRAIEENPPPIGPQPFLIGMEQLVELGFINAREMQTAREALYLTALPVTVERFAFSAQPFLTETIIREEAGRQSVDGKTNNWQFTTGLGFTKLFSTGALLLFNFANQTVYNLGKTKVGTSSVSTVSLDALQPFLQGGGRAVTLEPLTQAERNLLYAIRDYMRFRQQFFVYLASGQPTFIPGVTPGVGAFAPNTVASPAAASPTITATVPALALGTNPAVTQVKPGAGGVLGPLAGIAVTPQGFLGTIYEKGQLVNYYKNIQSLQRFLRQFEVYLEGGIVNLVQVGQVEQQLLKSIENVLGTQASYRISLDQLKQQLGLPLTVPLDCESKYLKPVIQQTERYEDLSADFDALYNLALGLSSVPPGELRGRLRRLFAESTLARDTRARERVLARWADWERTPPEKKGEVPTPLNQRLEGLRREVNRLRDLRASLQGAALPAAEQTRLRQLELELNLGYFERALRLYESEPWKEIKNADKELEQAQRLLQQGRLFRFVHRGFLTLGEEAFDERQALIREQWPPLPPVCVDGVDLLAAPEEEALATMTRACLSNRLDLMNNRAQLVDAWRKIAVAANALLGTFTVDYHLDASTPLGHGQPFRFEGSTTRNQLFFNGSPPLVRIVQRNQYRSTLVNYQQLRRFLMQNEDQALFEVRIDLRNLRAAANNYQRIQKRNIELAYRQVDQALQAFSQPQAPPGFAYPQTLVGPTAGPPQAGDPAALTTQLLNVQGLLLQAQNDLYNTWTSFLTTRMALYRDMGLMPLDSRGVWIDANAICDCNAAPASPSPAGPPAGQPAPEQPEQLPSPKPLPAAAAVPVADQR